MTRLTRPPGSAQNLAQALGAQLQLKPFLDDTTQWGYVAAVHGSTVTNLSVTASAGTRTIQTTAPVVANDMLVIGNLTAAIRCLSVAGTVATLAQPVLSTQASGAVVSALPTLDVYFDGTQALGLAHLRWGVRYLSTYHPVAGDTVMALRSIGARATDKLVLGKMDQMLPTVAMVGWSGSPANLAANVATTVPFNNPFWDTWGAFNTTTHKFRVPVAGYYRAWAKIFAIPNTSLVLTIDFTGSTGVWVSFGRVSEPSTAVNNFTGSALYMCEVEQTRPYNVGDQIYFQAQSSTGGAWGLDNRFSFCEITQVR